MATATGYNHSSSVGVGDEIQEHLDVKRLGLITLSIPPIHNLSRSDGCAAKSSGYLAKHPAASWYETTPSVEKDTKSSSLPPHHANGRTRSRTGQEYKKPGPGRVWPEHACFCVIKRDITLKIHTPVDTQEEVGSTSFLGAENSTPSVRPRRKCVFRARKISLCRNLRARDQRGRGRHRDASSPVCNTPIRFW